MRFKRPIWGLSFGNCRTHWALSKCRNGQQRPTGPQTPTPSQDGCSSGLSYCLRGRSSDKSVVSRTNYAPLRPYDMSGTRELVSSCVSTVTLPGLFLPDVVRDGRKSKMTGQETGMKCRRTRYFRLSEASLSLYLVEFFPIITANRRVASSMASLKASAVGTHTQDAKQAAGESRICSLETFFRSKYERSIFPMAEPGSGVEGFGAVLCFAL